MHNGSMTQRAVTIVVTFAITTLFLFGCTNGSKKNESSQTEDSSSSQTSTSTVTDTSSTIESSSVGAISDESKDADTTTSRPVERAEKDPEEKIVDNSVKKSFVPEKYKYVWGDEFDGTALDPKKWQLGYDMWGDDDLLLVKNDPKILNVKDGLLQLNAVHYYDPTNSTVQYATSFAVQTQATMNYQFGYMEMCAKVPYNQGAWPSFWSKSLGTLGERKNKDYFTEIDIFEVFASLDTAVPNIHKWYTNGKHTQAKEKNTYVFNEFQNLANEYHVYGFEWTSTYISMYIDGNKYMTFDLTQSFDDEKDMSGFSDPIYIILNNFLFTPLSSWKPYVGCEVMNTQLPMAYCIDWIRLYQEPGIGALYTSK